MPEKEEELLQKEIFMLLRKSLRPEFLNRVDEIVMFKPLDINQIKEIVKIRLEEVRKVLGNNSIELKMTDEAIDWLTERGYDPQSGARPVKRLIQKEIINELSKELIAGKISKDSVVKVSVDKGQLKFVSK